MIRIALLFLLPLATAALAQRNTSVLLKKDGADSSSGSRSSEVLNGFFLQPVGFNFAGMDFSPFPFKKGIVFVSSRREKGSGQGGDEELLTLFYTEEFEDGTFTPPEPLVAGTISYHHEGPAVFFDSGKQKIFTRNSFLKKSKVKDKSVNPLELAQSRLLPSGKWTEPAALVLSDPESSVAHPAISSDGTTLYFSSNMPGSVGESDLFVTAFKNGAWSAPRNLGASINTPGQELFPFLYNDSILYFSSNGRAGLGGLDLFYCDVQAGAPVVRHLQEPLNSAGDDFGFYLEPGGVSGFLSSNRPGGAGADDIYYFEEIQTFVEIQVTDSISGHPVPNAILTLENGDLMIGQTRADLMGRAELRLSVLRDYKLSVSAMNHQPTEIQLDAGGWSDGREAKLAVFLKPTRGGMAAQSAALERWQPERTNITNVITFGSSPANTDTVSQSAQPIDAVIVPALKVIVVEIVNSIPAIIVEKNDTIHQLATVSETALASPGLNLTLDIPRGAKVQHYEQIVREQVVSQGYRISSFLVIRSFFFDSGKTWIRNDASAQLDKIIEIMHAYPQFELQMTFHSDSRGTDAFNLDLSKARAGQVTAYLTRAGIIKDRIQSSFVGETQLLNDCGDLSDCDDLLHQINRTAEFKFIIR